MKTVWARMGPTFSDPISPRVETQKETKTDHQMRLLFISYGSIFNKFLPGGGATRVHKFSEFLSKRGWKVTTVTGNFPNSENVRTTYDIVFLGKPTNVLISLFSFSLNLPLFVKRKIKDYDLIVEDFSPFYASLAPLLHKGAIVQLQIYLGKHSLHRFPFPFNVLSYANEKRYPQIFERGIFMCDFLVKVFGFASGEKRYRVVWSGVEKDNLKHDWHEENFILYCGRVSEYMKGLDILLEAIRRIRRFLLEHGIHIAVVGDGPDTEKLRSLTQKYDLPVRFFGWFSDTRELARFYSRCLFTVLPSRYEGFGLSILEAASFSKTTLTSDIPAFSWSRHFCRSFRSENPDDLADKIIELVRNPEERRELGKIGRLFAEDKTWDKVSKDFERALHELM